MVDTRARSGTGQILTVDLSGLRFGCLTVVNRDTRPGRKPYWACECDCGNQKAIRGDHLRSGRTLSCGCVSTRLRKRRMTKHGRYKSPEYVSWSSMIQRCNNPASSSYHRYGGRGITVCERWITFDNFLKDMGKRPSPKHSLDRIQNNLGYFPGNCRWATHLEQCRNRSDNLVVEYAGQQMCLMEACERAGVSHSTAYGRIIRGLSIEEALRPVSEKTGLPLARLAV